MTKAEKVEGRMKKQCRTLAYGTDSLYGLRFAEHIIEMKQSGIEMTTFVRLLAVWNSWTLYEVLNV